MKGFVMTALLASGLMGAGQGFNMPSFSYFDADGDGKITKSELEDGRQKRHEKMLKEGRLLRNAPNAATFSQIDTDGDGFITPEEFSAHQKAMRSK